MQPDPDAGGSLPRPEIAFSFDAVGNLATLTDPQGNTTSFTYDARDRLIEEENELADSRLYAYNLAGDLTSLTDRNGRVREFAYDALRRLTQETWLDGETTVNTIDLAYDAASQVTTAEDAFAVFAYTYDDLGRPVEQASSLFAASLDVTLAATYNAVDSRTTLSAAIDVGAGYVDDFANEYTYDNLQRLTRLDQAGVVDGNPVAEKRIDLAYNALGQFTEIARFKALAGGSGNEVATTAYEYDSIARLTDLTHAHDATTIADYNLTYDLSRVTQLSFTALVGDDGASDYAAWRE